MAEPAALESPPAAPTAPEASPRPPTGTGTTLLRRSNQALPPAPRPSPWPRIAAAVAPWALLVLVALPIALYYRDALFVGKPRLLWGRRWALLALAVVPPLAVWTLHFARRRAPTLLFTRTSDVKATPGSPVRYLARLPAVLRLLAVTLGLVALARPQHESADVIEVEGIDMVIALDVSNSMSERDLPPTRIDAAKEVLRRFIEKRKSDRIGLVIFGRDAFTQCPLTLDYHALSGLLADVHLGLIDGKGTAIGNALATALNRLRRSDAKSRVIILLTDGDNNAGNVSPQQAAKFAQSLGVKVFTVLMGSDADYDANALFARAPTYPVNPKLLEEIAGATGGTPYLATDAAALEQRFQAILDELDRSRIKDQKGKPRELFPVFVLPALALLVLEFALSLTRFRRFP